MNPYRTIELQHLTLFDSDDSFDSVKMVRVDELISGKTTLDFRSHLKRCIVTKDRQLTLLHIILPPRPAASQMNHTLVPQRTRGVTVTRPGGTVTGGIKTKLVGNQFRWAVKIIGESDSQNKPGRDNLQAFGNSNNTVR